MNTVLSSRLSPTGSAGILSENIIPAIPGTHYVYRSTFDGDRPLYALLDCKANKSRRVAQVTELGREVHLHIKLVGKTRAQVSSMKHALAAGLIGQMKAQLDDVHLAVAPIQIEDFYTISAARDSARLEEICKAACAAKKEVVAVSRGSVIAVMTSGGKYCLFVVTGLSQASMSIEACHVQAK